MRKSNIIIKKVRNLMILSMAVIVIISVYFNILNSRAKETTDIVANVTDETGEVDSQKVTLVATGNKNGNYEISLPETISNVYVSNYKTLNGDKSANDKIVLSQDEVENKEINLEVNYDKKNVTSTKTNEEMTLYKQNLEYDDKGIYVEGYMPLLAQINVIQNENDISLEILYTVVESNNMSTKEIYVPSEYEQTLKITLNKKKYGVEQSLISSTDAEYIVVEQSDSKLVINNISSNTINITNEEVPTIISSQYNGEDNKYYFAGGPIANSQIESIKFVTNPKEVLGTKWDASENGDNSVIAGYIDSNGNELYEIYVASNSDKTTKVYTPEDASYMFYECSNLTTIDIQNLGTSKTTNMNSMFAMCTNITTLELQNFDTSNVEDMENMFFGCENLETLDISNFITAKVTTMCNMFQNCKKLTELNLESFDTSKVIDMNSMFNGCESLTILNLNNFNTTEVTDMSYMFGEGEALETLDVSKLNTNQVINMDGMFHHCKNLISLDVSEFDTSHVTDMSGMFNHCENLTSLDVSKFDTSQVKSMRWMFGNCESLTNLDVRKFDTSQVTNMKAMFQACRKLIELNISNFNTSQVTNMSYMFCNCSSLRSIYVSEYNETTGNGWTTKNVTDSDEMFTSATKLVGGNGTKFNSSYIDATYARIDKEGEPGYLTNIDQKASETESYVGYYADVDGDGTVDGIIFADLLHGKTGQWGDSNGTYTIPTIESTKVKSYKISQEDYTDPLGGTSKILTTSGDGNDRFYVMDLTNVGTSEYRLANSQMSGTITTFGSGKANTQTLRETNNLYFTLREPIESKVNKGWFIPSKEEWSAFGEELGITRSNYSAKGLSREYWSSSQNDTDLSCAWYADFDFACMEYMNGNNGDDYDYNYVRMTTTF